MTSETFTGNLGGLSGADAICNDLAERAGLPGTYAAWLSDETEDAIDRLGSANGWLRTDDRPFVRSRSDLLEPEKIIHPLYLDEKGDAAHSHAYTGTVEDGRRHENDCGGWTSEDAADKGREGRPGFASHSWTTSWEVPCSTPRHLYCFGVDHDNEPPAPSASGRIAFVSRGSFLLGEGRAGADRLCADEASEAGLSGSFKALLPTSTESAIARFSLAGDTWVRLDGVPIWESADDAETLPPLAPILLDAEGIPQGAGYGVWLGAQRQDAVGDSTCGDWTSADGAMKAKMLLVGSAGPYWSAVPDTKCDFEAARVFCLEE